MVVNYLYQYSLTQIRWATRRLMLDIKKSAKVVEIGSGGNPTPKSDILVEPYLHGEHQSSKDVIVDRPTFVMKAENLPFRDKSFDYSICFHVLEHTDDPEAFVKTLERISSAGYIETPTPLNELMFPYDFHMTAIAKTGENSLKAYGLETYDPKTLQKLRESIHQYVSSQAFLKFYRKNPTLFNTVLRWKEHLTIETIGLPRTAQDFTDYEVPKHPHHDNHITLKQKIAPILRSTIRRFCKNEIDIQSILQCSRCQSTKIQTLQVTKIETNYQCCDCESTFLASKNNIFWLK